MPTETQHLEQRVAALQSDLNARDQALDDAATESNERELSRRDWFDEAQRLEKECERLREERDSYQRVGIQAMQQLAERDALLRRALNGGDDSLGLDIAAALSAGAEPGAKPQAEPVYMVRTHGSCCWEEVGSGSLEDFQSMPEEYELRALYTHPAEQPAQKYDDTLLPFMELMRRELHANRHKGDRPEWLKMTASTALEEIAHHFNKLDEAVGSRDNPQIQEYAADIANICMMLLDICGVLAFVEQPAPAAVVLPERSPKDYAIEHAEYMAKSADDVLAKFQAYGLALLAVDEGGDDGEGELFEAIDTARGDLQESLVDLRGMVYEFRKRC